MTADQVITHFKGLYSAAIALEVTVTTIYNWEKKGIPIVRQRAIEQQTKGKLKAELRKRRK